MPAKITAIQADITEQEVDVIVNAANSSLLGGSGVDGAIHRAAGPALLDECRQLDGCKTGFVKATDGYNLAAKQIFHTVGPVWQGGDQGEAELLADCYQNSLLQADQLGYKTIAFPAISTGVYKFPLAKAAKVSVDALRHSLQECENIEEVRLCLFDQETLRNFQAALRS